MVVREGGEEWEEVGMCDRWPKMTGQPHTYHTHFGLVAPMLLDMFSSSRN